VLPLEVLTQLLVVHEQFGEQGESFLAEVKRVYQNFESVFRVKVEDKVITSTFQNRISELFNILGLQFMLAILGQSFARSLLNFVFMCLALQIVQQEIDVLFALKRL